MNLLWHWIHASSKAGQCNESLFKPSVNHFTLYGIGIPRTDKEFSISNNNPVNANKNIVVSVLFLIIIFPNNLYFVHMQLLISVIDFS